MLQRAGYDAFYDDTGKIESERIERSKATTILDGFRHGVIAQKGS